MNESSEPVSRDLHLGAEAALPREALPRPRPLEGRPVRAVGPSNRNGYSATLGRIVELLAALPPGLRRARSVRLCRADEERLRDGDARQLAANGVVLASSGDQEEWRCFLGSHFRARYDLLLAFDATETSAR